MTGAKTLYVTTFWRMTISSMKTNITALIIVAIIIMKLSITLLIKMAYGSIRIHSIMELIIKVLYILIFSPERMLLYFAFWREMRDTAVSRS
jgi:hypothetical protein